VVRSLDLDPDSAAVAVDAWRQHGVSGICAYNDETAIAILAGLRRYGLRSPDDLAIIGADDIPMARLTDPPLTTVAVDSNAAVQTMNSGSLSVTVRGSA
jgi:DNA-binding LacI/PurR family transcriptional regulator